jgi:hypothetical protein
VTDKSGKLEVTKTPNAENPVCTGKTPILTMDVWEHAYVSLNQVQGRVRLAIPLSSQSACGSACGSGRVVAGGRGKVGVGQGQGRGPL